MRVLVCGGRNYPNTNAVFAELDARLMHGHVTVIQGGAGGADYWARMWAMLRQKEGSPDVQLVTYSAEWEKHGKQAGPIRNQQMIDEGKPDIVLAFPGGKGTADMVKRAKAADLPIKQIWNDDE